MNMMIKQCKPRTVVMMMKPHIRMGLTKEKKEKEKSKETDTAPHTVICLFVLIDACMSIPLIPDKGLPR